MKLRIGEELSNKLGEASVKFAMGKCEIIRRAIRKYLRVKPVVVDKELAGSTYKGTVVDLKLCDIEDEDITCLEVRTALAWYLDIHKDAPATPRVDVSLVAGKDYILVDEEEEA